MREILKSFENTKIEVTARICQHGIKSGYNKEKLGVVKTLLLKEVRDSDKNLLSDHLWMKAYHNLSELEIGETIKFKATVIKYKRIDGTVDYGLTYPSKKVSIVSKV